MREHHSTFRACRYNREVTIFIVHIRAAPTDPTVGAGEEAVGSSAIGGVDDTTTVARGQRVRYVTYAAPSAALLFVRISESLPRHALVVGAPHLVRALGHPATQETREQPGAIGCSDK